MVYTDPNLYITGGIEAEYLMIPNLESFKQFCKKKPTGDWSYGDTYFKDDDLILLEFPAYFYLVKDSHGLSHWKKIECKYCFEKIDKDIERYRHQIYILELFKQSINNTIT